MSKVSLATNDATDMLQTILGQLPVVPSGELGEPGAPQQANVTAAADGTVTETSRRLAKLKHKLDRQSKLMLSLKRKIREKESMKPKEDSDREELAFLRNRLQKEAEVQRKLLEEVMTEQQRHAGTDGSQWQSIRLCPDKLDESYANPWTLGSVPMDEGMRFSCDSNLTSHSSSSSGEQAACEAKLTARFEKELLNRDRVIEILQGRLDRLSVDVRRVRQDKESIPRVKHTVTPVNSTPRFCETDMLHRLEFYRTNTDTLGKNLEQMEQALQCIQKELGPSQDGTKECAKPCQSEAIDVADTKRSSCCVYELPSATDNTPKDKDAQQQYGLLLQEYTKKSTECRQLSEQLAKAHAGPSEPSPDETEREMLKKRCTELLDEQDQFRILIREQATQLDDYRGKYLDAQQKVEEQRLQMDKLRITNKRVEAQINYEIEQIKRKFQDKLRELTPYPRLLEEEEEKTKQLKQSNETLYAELERALKQAKTLEDRLASVHLTKDAEAQQALQHSQLELSQILEQLQQLSSEKQRTDEAALQARSELEEFRAESARIIARTNERLEQERSAAQQRYAQLESELARCRAEAAFTISNREDALREMHNQIRVLSGSFDDAQLQIRSLRNQLSYLQNEKLVCLS